MKLTRRQFVVGAAAGAAGAAGIYELVDQLTGSSPARTTSPARFREQHLLDGIRVVKENDVEVLVPPLHHRLLTARVAVDAADLRDAQRTLEQVLVDLEGDYAPSPAGLGVTVAWGRPYFDHFVPETARRLIPLDRRAGDELPTCQLHHAGLISTSEASSCFRYRTTWSNVSGGATCSDRV